MFKVKFILMLFCAAVALIANGLLEHQLEGDVHYKVGFNAGRAAADQETFDSYIPFAGEMRNEQKRIKSEEARAKALEINCDEFCAALKVGK